jgi:hypothetical protein
LFHADCIKPAEGVEKDSFSALNEAGFERHRHSDTFFNVRGQVGLLCGGTVWASASRVKATGAKSVTICSHRAMTFFISFCRTPCARFNKRGAT